MLTDFMEQILEIIGRGISEGILYRFFEIVSASISDEFYGEITRTTSEAFPYGIWEQIAEEPNE